MKMYDLKLMPKNKLFLEVCPGPLYLPTDFHLIAY